MRQIILCLLCFFLLSPDKGYGIQITIYSKDNRILAKGKYKLVNDSAIKIFSGKQEIYIPVDSIDHIVAGPSAGHAIKLGAIIGGFAGGIIGLIVIPAANEVNQTTSSLVTSSFATVLSGTPTSIPPSEEDGISAGEGFLIGMGIGAGSGALIGAMAGLAHTQDTYQINGNKKELRDFSDLMSLRNH